MNNHRVFHFLNRFPQLKPYWDKYLPYQQRLEVPAKTILLEEGQVSKHYLFIEHGCLRAYFNKDGEYGLVPSDTIRREIKELDFRTFHDRLWTAEISLADAEAKQQYAWVHMQQLLNNLHSKRFGNSL